MKKAILFDLDGTLLKMDQDLFMKLYFSEFTKKMMEIGIDPKVMMAGMNAGVVAMIQNDGTISNEDRFWEVFNKTTGLEKETIKETADVFYKDYFKVAKQACAENIGGTKLIALLKEKGYKLICATNPMFPHPATHQRIEWAGLNVSDFDYITTYENSSYCKPNPKYYTEILEKHNLSADEVIMVGNDEREDGNACLAKIDVVFVTDELVKREDVNHTPIFKGTIEEVYHYFKENH